jgi:hypothetical protein
MSNIDLEHLTGVKYTSNYGLIKENIIFYDDQEILKVNLFNYKLYRIICRSEKNGRLLGLEIFYRDRITSKIVKTIDIKIENNYDLEEQEIILESKEMVNKIILWKDEALNGFEIKTNKDREQKFGHCGEGTKIELEEFNGNNYLCGLFIGFNELDGILSMGFYYINEIEFYLLFYYGIYCLRVKLRKEEFKNKIVEKLDQINQSDKALYKLCTLPNNQFYEILKYIII